jgi:hypothetical protein
VTEDQARDLADTLTSAVADTGGGLVHIPCSVARTGDATWYVETMIGTTPSTRGSSLAS